MTQSLDGIRLPVTLLPNRRKMFALLLGAAAFVAAGAWMVATGAWFGWVAIGFFGFCMVVALKQLMGLSARVELKADGFKVGLAFSSYFVKWEDVVRFVVCSVPPSRIPLVCWDYRPEYGGRRRLNAINKGLFGFESGLPELEMAPHELAGLMNRLLKEHRNRCA
jgi:hypothetical protein